MLCCPEYTLLIARSPFWKKTPLKDVPCFWLVEYRGMMWRRHPFRIVLQDPEGFLQVATAGTRKEAMSDWNMIFAAVDSEIQKLGSNEFSGNYLHGFLKRLWKKVRPEATRRQPSKKSVRDDESDSSTRQESSPDALFQLLLQDQQADRVSDLSAVRKLLKQPNADELLRYRSPLTLQTSLHMAVEQECVRLVKLILGAMRNLPSPAHHIDAKDRSGWTALHQACYAGNVLVCEALLEHDAAVLSTTADNFLPLHYLVRTPSFTTDGDTNTNTSSSSSSSSSSVREYTRLVRQLLKLGSPVNAQGTTGETMLHLACLRGNIVAVEILLGQGADVNVRNNTGDAPLHYAARLGDERIISMLLERGAVFNVAAEEGTPSEIAALYNHHKEARRLDVLEQFLSSPASSPSLRSLNASSSSLTDTDNPTLAIRTTTEDEGDDDDEFWSSSEAEPFASPRCIASSSDEQLVPALRLSVSPRHSLEDALKATLELETSTTTAASASASPAAAAAAAATRATDTAPSEASSSASATSPSRLLSAFTSSDPESTGSQRDFTYGDISTDASPATTSAANTIVDISTTTSVGRNGSVGSVGSVSSSSSRSSGSGETNSSNGDSSRGSCGTRDTSSNTSVCSTVPAATTVRSAIRVVVHPRPVMLAAPGNLSPRSRERTLAGRSGRLRKLTPSPSPPPSPIASTDGDSSSTPLAPTPLSPRSPQEAVLLSVDESQKDSLHSKQSTMQRKEARKSLTRIEVRSPKPKASSQPGLDLSHSAPVLDSIGHTDSALVSDEMESSGRPSSSGSAISVQMARSVSAGSMTSTLVDSQTQSLDESVHQLESLRSPRLHSYRLTSLGKPTWCSHCSKFILGVYKQALACTHCDSIIHRECEAVSLLKTICLGDRSSSNSNPNLGLDQKAVSAYAEQQSTLVSVIEKHEDCFTRDEIFTLYQRFCSLDSRGRGYATYEEFCKSMGAMGVKSNTARVFFDKLNQPPNGKLTFAQFMDGMRVMIAGSVVEQLTYAYEIFRGTNEVLTLGRVRKAFAGVGRALQHLKLLFPVSPERMIKEIFPGISDDSDEISRDLFVESCRKHYVFIQSLGLLSGDSSSQCRTRQHSTSSRIPITFGHEHWDLVKTVLLGIRRSVGEAVIRMDSLNSQTYKAKDLSLEVIFNLHRRNWRFTDFAPIVMYILREWFGVCHNWYMYSLGPEKVMGNFLLGNLEALCEVVSTGRSGSFFFKSIDSCFFIKTLPAAEDQLLRTFFPKYVEHVMNNRNTLLCRFLGLHRLLKRSDSLSFVVMPNVFSPLLPVHEQYDLKGSTVARRVLEKNRRPLEIDPNVALKDLDLDEKLHLGPIRKALLLEQLERDTRLLLDQNICDYSLLVGIHHISEESPLPVDLNAYQSPSLKPRTQLFDRSSLRSPEVLPRDREPSTKLEPQAATRLLSSSVQIRRRAATTNSSLLSASSPIISPRSYTQKTTKSTSSATTSTSSANDPPPQSAGSLTTALSGSLQCRRVESQTRKDPSVFCEDFGGMLSTDRSKVYFISLIDILTTFDAKKRLERRYKSVFHDSDQISAMPPKPYRKRFLRYIESIID